MKTARVMNHEGYFVNNPIVSKEGGVSGSHFYPKVVMRYFLTEHADYRE